MAGIYSKKAAGYGVQPGQGVEVFIRDVQLSTLPASFGLRRVRPYVSVGLAGSATKNRHKTGVIRNWKRGPFSFMNAFNINANPATDVLSLELWAARRLRRDILIGTANLSLAELQASATHGYAIDRWLPIIQNPVFQPSTGQGIGMIHVLARSNLMPPLQSVIAPGAQSQTLATKTAGFSAAGTQPLAVQPGMAAGGASGVSGVGMQQTQPYPLAGGSGASSAMMAPATSSALPGTVRELPASGGYPAGSSAGYGGSSGLAGSSGGYAADPNYSSSMAQPVIPAQQAYVPV